MIILNFIFFRAALSQDQSKISINGYFSARFDLKISEHLSIEIDNNKTNYIVILFHSYPGPFTLTRYMFNGDVSTATYIKNEDSFDYLYFFNTADRTILIKPSEEESVSFSIFSSSIGCIEEDEYFVSSKPNQTLVFKNSDNVDKFYKIHSKSSKCVLIDSGGTMDLSIKMNNSNIQSFLNHPQNYDFTATAKYSNPLFFTFIADDLNSNDQIEISYKSNFEYKHLYQTGEVINKAPEEEKKNTGVIRIDITVAIISGLFLVFILMTIIGLRRMRRMADAPSEDEGQSNDQLSVYEPESNDGDVEEKIQYPRKFSSEEEYFLSDESDRKVKEEVYFPPKDVFNMITNATEILEESDQNEIDQESSSSDAEENPYNHDATTTL